ncbi:hypothetical protein HMPREF6485_2753 [Segatella buccae ATCC 33574]|uniref:Uncharacterized protein n=1 Tax=Segatella buccae ATCC 33574 TaxID=873513 RepID=E6KAW6_9BACT|nr:hypothetical protein HMPREF6485_2753 [Segatella buccae ATCC 33574]
MPIFPLFRLPGYALGGVRAGIKRCPYGFSEGCPASFPEEKNGQKS